MDSEPIEHSYLQERHRELGQKFHQLARNDQGSESMKAAVLRTGRANSWISYAEGEPTRHEVAFAFLWIAFNALYGKPESSSGDSKEKPYISGYLDKMVSLDRNSRIEMVLATQRGHVDELLTNRYVSRVFWSRYRSRGYFDENRFKRDARRGGRSTVGKLELVFDRMYILRNQVFHGSSTSTAGGTTGISQVVQGSTIMRHMVPLFSLLTMENSEHGWEPPYFPGNRLEYDEADGSWKEKIEGVWREV